MTRRPTIIESGILKGGDNVQNVQNGRAMVIEVLLLLLYILNIDARKKKRFLNMDF